MSLFLFITLTRLISFHRDSKNNLFWIGINVASLFFFFSEKVLSENMKNGEKEALDIMAFIFSVLVAFSIPANHII